MFGVRIEVLRLRVQEFEFRGQGGEGSLRHWMDPCTPNEFAATGLKAPKCLASVKRVIWLWAIELEMVVGNVGSC